MISERIRRRLELRRSNAAGPHSGKDPYALGDQDMADFLAEWEEDREYWEPGELYTKGIPNDGR